MTPYESSLVFGNNPTRPDDNDTRGVIVFGEERMREIAQEEIKKANEALTRRAAPEESPIETLPEKRIITQ